MKFVSEGYKRTMAQTIRPTTQFQAILEITDREAENTATFAANDKAKFSSNPLNAKNRVDYITFEKDFYDVGGSKLIAPSSGYSDCGYVSSSLTNENGDFVQKPVISMEFKSSHEFVGLSFFFIKDYPRNIHATATERGSKVLEFDIRPTGLECNYRIDIPACTKITLTFDGMHDAYRRLRIANLMLGVTKIFNTSDVISTNHKMYTDPISSTLSYNTLEFRVENFSKEFDPDNPRGIWEFVENGQPVRVRYGVDVSGTVEWLDSSNLLLKNAPTVGANYVSFVAQDKLQYLTGMYLKGEYYPSGRSLFDLAEDVLKDAGVQEYILPDLLKSVITYAPIPKVAHREALQLIANAARCILYCDAQGRIVIEPQLEAKVTVTDNGHAPWGDSNSAYNGSMSIDYITFEPNKWKIGNSQRLILGMRDVLPNGFVSSDLSSADGRFKNPPKVFVSYSLPVSSFKFSLEFDTINQEYAEDFNIIFSNDSTTVDTISVRGNKSARYEANKEVLNYNKVTVEILKINNPYHRIKISKIDGGRVTDYYLDYSIALEKPTVHRLPTLRNVNVSVQSYSVDSNLTDIYRETRSIYGVNVPIEISYAACTDREVTVSGGTLTGKMTYATYAVLLITANGNVSISVKGKKLLVTESTVTVGFGETGEDCPVKNPLITDAESGKIVGEWVGNYCQFRSSYELSFRQDYRLDCNDIVYMQSEFEDHIPARITKLQYNLPGQRGYVKLRRLT